MARQIDGDALFAVVRGHHDLYKGATNPADKARRDECLQVMCDINDAPTIPAIQVDWIRKYADTVGSRVRAEIVREMLDVWQKEQEGKK